MTTDHIIRVLIVDDHKMLREGLAVFLKRFDNLMLVGEASNGTDAIRQCQELAPDVVLMDMVMPGMDGVTATRQIREKFSQIQVIALTSFNDNSGLVKSALEAGALGFLFKDVSTEELANAIQQVFLQKPVLSPEATRMLIQTQIKAPPPTFNLSDREKQVLKLMIEGQNNREIGEHLFISVATVKFHVSSILAKLNVGSRTEAVATAVQHNLTDGLG